MTDPATIYLDNHASTPTDPQVLEAMLPYLTQYFGNAGSSHICGRQVKIAVDEARSSVATLLGADPDDFIFTSGATESINLAIKGVARARRHRGRHIITSTIEHKAVLDSCHYLEAEGYTVTYLQVDRFGCIDLAELQKAIFKGPEGDPRNTILISLMVANNEIGTIQPIHDVAHIARSYDIALHFDAAQAVGKVPLNLGRLDCDLLSFSGHKMYGPKGVGGLFFRKSARAKLPIEPQIHGGGQEFGLRSGTQAVHLIVGLGSACAIAHEEFEVENTRIEKLRNQLESKLKSSIPGIVINGHPIQRLCGNLHVSIPNLDGDLLPVMLQKVCCSARSACSSESQTVSYVLTALGLDEKLARASLRFGVGRFNTSDEIDEAAKIVIEAVKRTRRFSMAEASTHTA